MKEKSNYLREKKLYILRFSVEDGSSNSSISLSYQFTSKLRTSSTIMKNLRNKIKKNFIKLKFNGPNDQ